MSWLPRKTQAFRLLWVKRLICFSVHGGNILSEKDSRLS